MERFLRYELALTLCVLAGCARQGLAPTDDVPVTPPSASEEDAGPPQGDDAGPPDEAESPEPPDPPDPQACAVLEANDTLTRVPVDIVWVVDDSLSMLDEQARIRENIASFATRIGADGVDVRVVFVTESDLAQGTALAGQPNYLFVEADVGSNDGLEVLLEEQPRYASHLRPDARTHFVAVTDDESDLPSTAFQNEMKSLLGRDFTFHAIASENLSGRACRGAASPGDEYYALAASTGGSQVSICTLDWGAVFDTLLAAVLAGSPLPCSFALPAAPDGELLDPDRVKFDFVDGAGVATEIPRLGTGECGILVAWSYDDGQRPTSIELCPQACKTLEAGGSVRVALGCAPTLVE